MTAVLLDLGSCVVTDTGEVIVSYDALFDRLRDGKPIYGLCTSPHDNVDQSNQRHPQKPLLRVVEIDGVPGQFPAHLYEWKIPQRYRDLDLDWYVADKLVKALTPDMNMPIYADRCVVEMRMMRERGMEEFIRLLIYLTDTFEQHGVVHGIGRGSACASLVLYLLGVHLVDPIRYNIPIEEFLRQG